MSGQVIWHGKTEWVIGGLDSDTTLQFTFSETHRCREATLLELVASATTSSFHRSKSVIAHIKAKLPWCKLVFIPPQFIGQCLPLDLSYNQPLERGLLRRAAEGFARQVVHQGVGGIDVRIGTMRPLLNRWLRESMVDVGANDRVDHLAWRHYIAPTDGVAARVVDMRQRHTDGTLLKEEVAAEQGDDAAGLEEPEAEAVPLFGGEAVGDSDAGEELLAEEDAMVELAEAALADADEAPQIAGIALVEVDNVLEAPLALASRGPSASAMEIEIRAGTEKAKRCGFLAAICGRQTAKALNIAEF